MAGRVHRPMIRLRASIELSGVHSSTVPGGAMPKHRAPTSLEAELRSIISTANQSHSELKNFQNGYHLSGMDSSKVQKVGQDVLEVLGVSEISCIEDFKTEIKADRKRELTLRQKPNYEMLEALCDRAKDFEFSHVIRKRLNTSIKQHLCKYCVSFAEEAKGLDIKCVKDYDVHIGQYKDKLEEKSENTNKLIARYDEIKAPFVGGFLENCEEINQIISDVTDANIEMCDIMKQWAQEDKRYPKKLWDEIINSNLNRGKVMEDVKKLKRKKEDLVHQVTRRDAICDRAQDKLDNSKRERKKTADSANVVKGKVEREEMLLESKKTELSENEQRIKERKTNSPMLLDMLWAKGSQLEEDINRAQERLDALKRQMNRLDKSGEEGDKKVKELEEDMKTKTTYLHNYVDRLNAVNKELKNNLQVAEQKQARIAVAKKIREMKLSQAVLRKLHYNKFSSERDSLVGACQFIADNIGGMWQSLYLTLPFAPPREKSKRFHDLEVVDHRSIHQDKTAEVCAAHCLTKWRTLNHQSSIVQLLKTLYKLDETQLAHRLDVNYVKPRTTEMIKT